MPDTLETLVGTDKTPSRGIQEIRRMWKDGPLRWWMESKTRPKDGKKWTSYCAKDKAEGWAGSYVCDQCQRSVDGVYQVAKGRWVCGTCRGNIASRTRNRDSAAAR